MVRASSSWIPWLSLAASAAAVLAGCGGKTDTPVVAPDGESPSLKSVIGFVEDQMARCGIPGGAIAVVERGHLTEEAGVGVKDASGDPVNPTTLFQTAALSKVVVGAAALRLVEQGQLDLGQPVTRYVPMPLAPGFDPAGITVAELLTHTAGLPDLDTSVLQCPTGAGQLASFFAANGTPPLWTPPGAVWNYNQRGYAVAGWIVETASGQAFESAVASRVFRPAGMTTATYDPATVLASGDYATGHDIDPDTHAVHVESPGAYDCAASRPPDGVFATVVDFAHFAETLLAGGGAMLTPASVGALETGQTVDELYPGDRYTYGLYVHEGYKGLHMLRADGDMHGQAASLLLVPDQSFAVVVFFDGYDRARGCSTDDAAEDAASVYLGLTSVPGPDWLTPPSAWSAYAGTYVDPYELGAITVAVQGESLVATTGAYGAVTLTQQSATAFTGMFGDREETVTFDPDANGPGGWFVTRLGVGKRQ